jgi:hypothetical protein
VIEVMEMVHLLLRWIDHVWLVVVPSPSLERIGRWIHPRAPPGRTDPAGKTHSRVDPALLHYDLIPDTSANDIFNPTLSAVAAACRRPPPHPSLQASSHKVRLPLHPLHARMCARKKAKCGSKLVNTMMQVSFPDSSPRQVVT